MNWCGCDQGVKFAIWETWAAEMEKRLKNRMPRDTFHESCRNIAGNNWKEQIKTSKNIKKQARKRKKKKMRAYPPKTKSGRARERWEGVYAKCAQKSCHATKCERVTTYKQRSTEIPGAISRTLTHRSVAFADSWPTSRCSPATLRWVIVGPLLRIKNTKTSAEDTLRE